MYNYTVFTDDNGVQCVRWLKREFVPRTPRKRSAAIDPKGSKSWALAPYNAKKGPNCPVVIMMCFFNGVTRDRLRAWVDAGIKEVLIIRETIKGDINANVGYRNDPSNNPNTFFDLGNYHMLNFDLNSSGDEQSQLGDMLHELGHVLGLFHEHQRRDAGQYITFHCQNLPNYDLLTTSLRTFPFTHPYSNRPITMSDICNDFVIPEMIEQAASGSPIPRPPNGNSPAPPPPPFNSAAYTPYRFIANQPDLSPQGLDVTAYRDMIVSDGVFDWDPYSPKSSDTGAVLMTKVGKTGQDALWVSNTKPALGDLKAINQLYSPMP